MRKDDLNVHVFQNRNWGPFHKKDCKWKKIWVYGISFTVKFCMQNLTKEWKQSPVVILHQANFYSIFILCFWLRIIRRSDQSVWFMNFSSQIFYNDINHAYRATMFKKKFCGCFRLIWLWLLIVIIKKCTERCALHLYRKSLSTFILFQL